MTSTPLILYGDPPPFVEAQWIWSQGAPSPCNFYLHVRRGFQLGAKPRTATINVTADSRYKLFVNGSLVGRGPARCDRLRQDVDTWDVADRLVQGPNVIAVLVQHIGEPTHAYQPGRAGLIAELDTTDGEGKTWRLGTGDSWRVLPAEAWTNDLERMNRSLGFPEIADRRREPPDWTDAGFNDKSWSRAVVLGPPGTPPWSRLHSREIPGLVDYEVHPTQLIEAGESHGAQATHRIDMVGLGTPRELGVGYVHTYVRAPRRLRATLWIATECSFKIWCSGRPLLTKVIRNATQPRHDCVQVFLERGWNSLLLKLVGGCLPSSLRLRLSSPEPRDWVFSGMRDKKDPSWLMIAPFACPDPIDPESGLRETYPPEEIIERSGVYDGLGGRSARWHRVTPTVTGPGCIAELVAGEMLGPSAAQAVSDAAALVSSEGPITQMSTTPEKGTYLLIDFGRQVAGHPRVHIVKARGGEVLDLAYAEVLEDHRGRAIPHGSSDPGRLNPMRGGVMAADRFICAPGPQTIETFERRSFRYLQLTLRNCLEPIEIESVSCLMTHYPVEARGAFRCSDHRLQQIWEIGAYTVQLNMEDAYTNSPWRDRAQCWLDGRTAALTSYVAFGDLALARRGLRQVGRSQDEEGFTRSVWPAAEKNNTVADATLAWILALRDYHLYSGDVGLVAELLPYVARALGAFTTRATPDGLVEDLPAVVFIDCADVERRGRSAGLNAMLVGALRAGAALAAAVGETRLSEQWQAGAEALAKAMRDHLLAPARGVLRDGIVNGRLSDHISQHANALALLFDVFEKDQWPAVTNLLEAPTPDVITPGSPYFSGYLLSALERAGRHAQALSIMREQWGRMVDFGATTWWELWSTEGSHCHAWSSGPTHLLSTHVLGVRPTSPGFSYCLVSPHTESLDWAEGRVPTPHGEIQVSWERAPRKGQLDMRLHLPDGVRATLVLPISPTSLRINGRVTLPAGVVRDNRSERYVHLTTSNPVTVSVV